MDNEYTTHPGAGLPWSGKNIWKMIFFEVRGKSGNFVDGQGNLERTWKVREKSGNLKINGYGRQSSENYLFCSRGEMMYFLRDCLRPSPSSLGLLLKGRICFLWEQILPFKSIPKFEVIQLAPL